jgi:glycopeptide antibiotics resistance protein
LAAVGTTARRARVVLAGYVLVVAVLTLPPVIEPWLLASLTRLTARLSGSTAPHTVRFVEPGLNVALFVPLALLLCWALPRLGRWSVWVVCVLGSAAIELTQFLFLPGRDGTLRDVVTNSTGAALGVLLHWVLSRPWRRRSAQSVRQQ